MGDTSALWDSSIPVGRNYTFTVQTRICVHSSGAQSSPCVPRNEWIIYWLFREPQSTGLFDLAGFPPSVLSSML